MKVLYVFIDGVGLAPPSDHNPVNESVCPTLCTLIRYKGTPIDACLDMPGLPQSATGQATLYTGVNAAQYMGRHKEGFPGPTLCRLLQQDNLFMRLRRNKKRVCFADAYFCDTPDELNARRFKSVTTIMGLTCPEVLRFQRDMLNGQAILHDLTRQAIVAKGYTGPQITPEVAATQLMEIARAYDFTLFEYFLTDITGHSQDKAKAEAVLRSLDKFFAELITIHRETDLLLIITSDHGNIEDLSTRGHTFNKVPLIALGPGAQAFTAGATSLIDVMGRVLKVLLPQPAPQADLPLL